MTAKKTPIRVVVLIVWLLAWNALLALEARAQSMNRRQDAPQDMTRFDIDAQPLDTALEQYGAASGRPVIFDSALVAGRVSTSVHGVFGREAALQLLLTGTGLAADAITTGQEGAFVLKTAPNVSASSAVSGDASDASVDTRGYDGQIQSAIRDALCSTALAKPGDYSTAIRFDIDATGHIEALRLLHSTGNRDRDLAIQVVLGQVSIGEPPPPAMPLPIYMAIVPHGPECPAQP
ncbi:TonB C-terminal domain-containing protein [Pararobbsia silviterrae]|uniref:Secretin/TonB short N-terminal domain-containing protein n=1 Tax=Pararobbsia silviterrae TaxID=1792498 RepID=A0A494YC17_9BURK|nr:TonB C-terminal domain-containing protein [Pararobbsia silviterrae]RKP57820.1 hypothetical protein D7S86_07800 [Pararobbsia silviterrae]